MKLKDIDMDHEFVAFENGEEIGRLTVSGCLDDDKTVCITDIFAKRGRGRQLVCKSMASLIDTGGDKNDPVMLVPVQKDAERITQRKLEKLYESLSFKWNKKRNEMRSTLGNVLHRSCQLKKK